MTPEGRVKKAVKRWLTEAGAYYYMPMSNGMGRVGAPDFLVCLAGRFVGIETKAPGKRYNTTANQRREIQWINMSGGVAMVVDDAAQLEVLRPLIGGDKCAGKEEVQEAGAQVTG
jgi:hypothetical protein